MHQRLQHIDFSKPETVSFLNGYDDRVKVKFLVDGVLDWEQGLEHNGNIEVVRLNGNLGEYRVIVFDIALCEIESVIHY